MVSQNSLTYEEIIRRFLDWAHGKPDIRAAIVIGSRARADHPADVWSDLDLVVICEDPSPYFADATWLRNFGAVHCTFLERQAVGEGVERRALYEGCLDVDFAFIPTAWLQQALNGTLPPEVAAIFLRGYRFILDKDNLSGLIDPAKLAKPAVQPPSEHEFLNVCRDYWYHAVWTMKKLSRGEIWMATLCLNSHMAVRLLQMLEWHSHAVNGVQYDTWHGGRFLDQWADPRAVKSLGWSFAHYGTHDIQRALLAQMDLFRWVAREAAERMHYPYPASEDEYCAGWVKASLLP